MPDEFTFDIFAANRHDAQHDLYHQSRYYEE